MCKKSMTLCLVILLALGTLAQAANIIWVSDNIKYDYDTNTPSDIGFVELLEAQGHTVIYKDRVDPVDGEQYWRELDPNKIAELEAADLIIMSRDVASSTYDDANEAEMWNALSTPLVSMSAHVSRAPSKWGWFNTTGTSNKTPRLMGVVDANHPIFAGITVDPNGNLDVVDPNAQVTLPGLNEGEVAGNGVLLGVHDENYPWIVEWTTGIEYYEGSGQIAGGPRMFLGFAAGKTMGGLTEAQYNLTTAGEQLFLNIVNYMLPGSASVIWVTGAADSDEDGIQDDMGWVNWLEAQGYDVDIRPGNWSGSDVDPNKIAELEAADLVMISRRISSGDPKAATFNPISTPIINLNAWAMRSSRLKWFNSGTALKYNGAPIMLLASGVDTHPIFDGIDVSTGGLDVLDPNVGAGEESVGNTSFVDITDAGNGTVLGTALGEIIMGQVFVAEWAAGVEYYEGAGQIAGGPRMAFMAGTQDRNDSDTPDMTIPPTSGVFNLTEVGAQLMSNAVAYMIGIRVKDPGMDNLVAYYPLDGDVMDASGNMLDGTIVGEPVFVEGMVGQGLQLDGVDDYVDCGNDPLFDFSEEVTLSTWFNVNDFGNGENDPWVSRGDHCWAIKGHRNGSAIEFFVYESGWKWIDVEVGDINNEWHHAAGTFDGDKLKIYLDGELVATKDTTPGIAATTVNVMIGTNSEHFDRVSEGIQDEVKIYSKALTAGEVIYIMGM